MTCHDYQEQNGITQEESVTGLAETVSLVLAIEFCIGKYQP